MAKSNPKGHLARLRKKRQLREEGKSTALVDVDFATIEKRITYSLDSSKDWQDFPPIATGRRPSTPPPLRRFT